MNDINCKVDVELEKYSGFQFSIKLNSFFAYNYRCLCFHFGKLAKLILLSLIIVELGPNLSWGFGPKVNTKLTLETTTTTHHHTSPKTFRRVLGIAGGQNLVCGLYIGQWTKTQSVNPPWWSPATPSFKTNFFMDYL